MKVMDGRFAGDVKILELTTDEGTIYVLYPNGQGELNFGSENVIGEFLDGLPILEDN